MSRSHAAATLALLIAISSGCADERPAGDAGGRSSGGTVVVLSADDLLPMNSLVNAGRYGQEMLRFGLALPLLAYDPDLEYEPALARTWTWTGDTAVVFELRDDVFWHDGERTTAWDVEFTFGRAMGAGSTYPNAADFEAWTGVEVLDSFKVRFRVEPHADPLAGVPFLPVMPRHLLDSIPPERMGQAAFNRHPVGNGPFRFVEYRPNDRWIFEANPDFPEALGGRPRSDRIVWRVVPESAAQLAELRTDNAHLALNVPAGTVITLDPDGAIRPITRESRQYAMIGWNGRRPPLGDARIRRALTLAMDRQRIIDVIRVGHGYLATGPVGRYHWSRDESLAPLPFDAEAARSLLAEAGLRDQDGDGVLERPDGTDFTVELLLPPAPPNPDLAELIRTDLAAVGVAVEPRIMESATIVSRIIDGDRDFDAALMAWEADFRLGLRSTFHSSDLSGPFQIAGYANAAVDSLIERTERMPDRDAARPLHARLQRILRDDQPWAFLYYYDDLFVARQELAGADMDIRGALVNLPRWYLAGSTPGVAR